MVWAGRRAALDNFRNPSGVDAQRGDYLLQAGFRQFTAWNIASISR